MIERTQHAAGFTVVDRRREHSTTHPVSGQRLSVGPRGEAAVTETLAPSDNHVHRDGYGRMVATPPTGAQALEALRHARSVIAGSHGAYAAPLNDEQRYARYMLQERCRRDGVGRGDRVPTSKQRRRIDHKRNRAMSRLTTAALVK